MRLIDADALISIIKIQLDKGETLFNDVMKKFIDILEHSPTIDAMSEVHGEWIKEGCAKGSEMCNQCGFIQFEGRVDNYCPNCGAHMKGADDE